MKANIFVLTFAAFVLTACTTTRDITDNPGKMTDFRQGQEYRLKEAIYSQGGGLLCRFYGDTALEHKYRTAKPSWIDGVLDAGTLFQIQKITVTRSPETGKDTEIFAEVLSGDWKGRIVPITGLSTLKQGGSVVWDPNMLEPVKN